MDLLHDKPSLEFTGRTLRHERLAMPSIRLAFFPSSFLVNVQHTVLQSPFPLQLALDLKLEVKERWVEVVHTNISVLTTTAV